MKLANLFKITALAAAILCSPLTYANNATTNTTTANIATDAEIISAIQSQLSAEKTTSDLKIQVSSSMGKVSLKGNVNTDAEAGKVIEIADSIQGVRDVDASQLTVQESQHPLTDTIITAKVKGAFVRDKLFGDRNVPLTSIKVETTNGVVYLTGTVDTQEEAKNAETLASGISGVKSVESKLEVKPAS